MSLKDGEEANTSPPKGLVRSARLVHFLGDPVVLFPLIALTVIATLWAITYTLVRNERADAEQAARLSTLELASTYEAQLVRALREIDDALSLVHYMVDREGPEIAIEALASRALLPPDVLFVVSVTDASGQAIASTRALDSVPVVDMAALRNASLSDNMLVGQARFDEVNQEWWIDFSRLVRGDDGSFAGAVTIAADAFYFVSGYDLDQLGEFGLLGLIGNDGVFRVRRSGDTITYGTPAQMDDWLATLDVDLPTVELISHSADGIDRYTNARPIFGFPLTLALGLSRAEQHAAAESTIRTYRWRTGAATLLVLLLSGLLGRMSWQLHRSRLRIVEEQIAHAQQVEYLAFHDGLTGLPNRSLFAKLLHQEILKSRRNKEQFAVMFLDIDKFKLINDSLGHDAGDQLLNEVAQRTRAALRESDILARMGGDEFTILLPGTSDEDSLLEISRKILTTVRKTYVLAGQEVRITVSIGASVYPRNGEDEESLLKHADVAMYHAKEEGRNNFKFYTEGLNINSLERLSLETSLRNAIENKELRLFYQGKRDFASGEITGMEALLRWQHPDLGLILPMQFIPLAEETGLIIPIGRWVLETACRQSVIWRTKGMNLSMAVNLSAVQFRDENLLEDLERILSNTGMAPQSLELEITESMIMSDLPKAVQMMGAMKNMGVHIAIDDFGTGYSSLSALKDFPIDTIKIDGSFIADIVANKESQGLAQAIIAMGRTLGLSVIAEGVETKEQMDYLKTGTCDAFQGFYLNTPMPPEEFETMLNEKIGVSFT